MARKTVWILHLLFLIKERSCLQCVAALRRAADITWTGRQLCPGLGGGLHLECAAGISGSCSHADICVL